ncbi:uncharacterized protein LOC117892401 isoform X1 [Drosophila subobscura]|uniref:uncharacterized protein LOC117892401 isoform X1 n=1 Tax=Drosophila subobscura TaxID=7241 RepID=UPI00155AB2CF|nr:uncharacterized protein LOC117892401 isoform X1 [Drosophila subobscura]XP_034654509.1 uncharacterized protein LOC117892401 isoform X1 [Drosophila subobscura]XP_034654510.1 uncharacterized protein LOC117892401 isoform X1 [Drosophila subobscura]
MTEVEQPPQNGIDPTAGDHDEDRARPADIEQDMREMERRKRVEAIMGSRLFREELERIVDSAREGNGGASGILQQLSDIVGVPVSRVGSVFKSSSCMVPINDIRGVESMGYAKGEKILRCKLAATFRLLDLYGWTQGLGAQITARLKVDQEYFLVNPYGLLYHEVTASALNKVDMQGQIVEQGTTNFGVNKSHFVLHSVVHAARPDIRCAIYVGCSPVVAISSLKTGLLPLTRDACVLGEITTHAYTGLLDEEERNRLVRSLGPNSKVILLANHGALCCGETIEEAFFAACHIVQACETQLKLLPVGVDNLVLIPEETRKIIYDQSRRPPEDLEKKFAAVTAAEDGGATAKEPAVAEQAAPTPKIGSPPKWRVGGADFEALMRMLDNAGYRTGYIYRHPLIKSDPPKPKNDVELPPAVSSLGYLLEEEELFRQGIWKKGDLRKGGDRSRWLNSPNVYQKVEVLETGTPDPKKITKWVAEGSPTHSTPVRIEDPLQFVPCGTNTKEFKRVQQQIKDNRRADKISAGPQSHILEGVTWDEANRIKDATVSQAGDHVVLMGAASKGIIQRGFQHNATVYKAPYAKNPFDNVTDDELNEYKRTVERKKKSIHGEYTDTDFSESEALNSMQAAGALAHAKHAQSEPETEHQIIQIQTQQAPIPSQAEVVLSDGLQVHEKSSMGEETPQSADANNNEHEVDKENHQLPNRSVSSNSKCRRDLFPATKSDPPAIELDMGSVSGSGTWSRLGDLAQHLVPAQQGQDQLYSYVYAAAAAASLAQCTQPEICSALLRTLHAEQLVNLATCYRCSNGTPSTGTGTGTSTGSNNTARRQLEPVHGNLNPPPYRTLSHFGFQSPRQIPVQCHKHLPSQRDGFAALGYRPMQRAISYEEIFASPRYEQLCQPCIDQLLRLKPELQRLRAPTISCCEEELVSLASSSITPKQRRLAPLPEIPQQDASTQTLLQSPPHFLSEIERFNFSEESTNVGFTQGVATITSEFSFPGMEGSPAASATSAPPARVYPAKEPGTATETNITEVWNFGNWQESAEQNPTVATDGQVKSRQQPLTERRITLEITQHFEQPEEEQEQEHEQEQEQGRQLMTRDERRRRKSEFQELWQDHVQYFGDKEKVQQKPPSKSENPLKMSLDEEEVRALRANGWPGHEGQPEAEENEAAIAEVDMSLLSPTLIDRDPPNTADELPQILQDCEESLSLAVENLQKLVATTQNLQSLQVEDNEEPETGALFRSISLENIPNANDSVCLVEMVSELGMDLSDSSNQSSNESIKNFEEKHDDEKPVTPVPKDPEEATEKEKVQIERNDEKDVDENEFKNEEENEIEGLASSFQSAEATETEPFHGSEIPIRYQAPQDSETFSPLELEILERIEVDKLSESEPIFGKIDHSIRNKLTPQKLQHLVREEIFHTCTRVFTCPSPISPSTTSALSIHNITAPGSYTAHTHLVTRPSPRLSQSLSNPQKQQQLDDDAEQSEERETQCSNHLKRTISSTTFVCRRGTHRKRNFIQENIRNVGKTRSVTKPSTSSIKKPRNLSQPTSTASLSSVCTFEIGQKDNGSRLWVSVPTPPRAAVTQKRNAATSPSANCHLPRSPYSPQVKRRKPGLFLTPVRRCAMNPAPNISRTSSETSLNYSLDRSLSSSTFCLPREGDPEADNVSTTTFEVDYSQDQEPPNASHQNVSAAAMGGDSRNATTSTMYYSASDSTQDQKSGRSVDNGGETFLTSDDATEDEATNDISDNGDADSTHEQSVEKSSSQVKEADTETSCKSSEGMPSIKVEASVDNAQTTQDTTEEDSSSLDGQSNMEDSPLDAESNVSSSTSFKSVLEMSTQSGDRNSEQTPMANQSEGSDKGRDETNGFGDTFTKITSVEGERESSVVEGELRPIEADSMEESIENYHTAAETIIPESGRDDEKPDSSKESNSRAIGGLGTVASDDEDDEKVVLSTSCTLQGMQIHVWDEKEADMMRNDEDYDK